MLLIPTSEWGTSGQTWKRNCTSAEGALFPRKEELPDVPPALLPQSLLKRIFRWPWAMTELRTGLCAALCWTSVPLECSGTLKDLNHPSAPSPGLLECTWKLKGRHSLVVWPCDVNSVFGWWGGCAEYWPGSGVLDLNPGSVPPASPATLQCIPVDFTAQDRPKSQWLTLGGLYTRPSTEHAGDGEPIKGLRGLCFPSWFSRLQRKSCLLPVFATCWLLLNSIIQKAHFPSTGVFPKFMKPKKNIILTWTRY